MRCGSLAISGFLTVLAIHYGVPITACAEEAAGNSTIRVASVTEPTGGRAPAAGVATDNWGESELRFELSPTVSTVAPSHPNTAQRSYPVRPASFTAPATTKPLTPPTSTRSRSVTGIYTNPSSAATLSKIPRPAPVQHPVSVSPVDQPARPRGKPFQAVESGPTVSPYLNLYRNDANTNTISNYYSFVRPQLDQIEANRRQAADMQRLRAQLQNAQSAGGSQPVMYGDDSSRPAPVARFGYTAQFYEGSRR